MPFDCSSSFLLLSVVCDRVNVGLCMQIKPPVVGEHAFPLTGCVCKTAHVTEVLDQRVRSSSFSLIFHFNEIQAPRL